MRFILEVDDEPVEALPFAPDTQEFVCEALGIHFTADELAKLDKYTGPTTETPRTRTDILDEAKRIVTGKRDEYGTMEDSFDAIAELWSAYLSSLFKPRGIEIGRVNVAVMMVLLKVARSVDSEKLDNYIDMAGYAACAGEMEASC